MKYSTLSSQDLISFVPLPSWIRAAVRCGFAIAPVLHEMGVRVTDRGTQGVVITHEQSFRLMEACVDRSKGEHFPFVFGDHCVLEAVPEIQAYVCSCETLRDAIKSYSWVRDLMSNGVNLSVHETESYAQIRIHVGHPKSRSNASIFFAETLAASVRRLIIQLVGHQEIEQLTFRHAPPDYADVYSTFFGVATKFDQETDAVVIRTELLDRPLNGAVPELHQQARTQILQRVSKLSSLGNMVGQLKRLFAEHPDLLVSGLEAAAEKLVMHPRTLQRRLQEENQTFADVQSEFRFQITCSLLRNTDCSVNEISEKLGFSDRRAFTRAFKRWSNVSPSCYRDGRPVLDRHHG